MELTEEWILKILTSLGFKKADAEVYALLSRNGSQKAHDIAEGLETYKRQVYRSSKNCERRES